MAKMTQKGARSVSNTLDRVASLFQKEHATLGIPERIANDFAHRCDLLSDEIEKRAGITREALSELDVAKETGFDPEEIGEEVSGPLEDISAKGYMKGEFTQQENRELRERQEAGDLGASVVEAPQAPLAGKQASFADIGRRSIAARLSAVKANLQDASLRMAAAQRLVLAAGLNRLGHAVIDTQVAVVAGTVNAARATATLEAVNTLLPYVAEIPADSVKIAKMIALAIKVAGEMPPWLKDKVKGKGEEDKKEEKEEKEEKGKEAADHGFRLDA